MACVYLGTETLTMAYWNVKVNPFKVATWSGVCLFRDGYADNAPFNCQSLSV
jgi:hypothetical protein